MQKCIAGFLVASFCITISPAIFASSLLETAGKTVEALVYVRNEINNRYQTYLNAEDSLTDLAKEKLKPIEAKVNTLRDQVAAFDENIRRANLNLAAVQKEIKGIQLEMGDLSELAEMREVELARSKALLNEFIRLMYQETMQYTDWDTGEISTMKFLLQNDSLSATEIKQTYLSVLQSLSVNLINDLNEKQSEYNKANSDLLVKKGELVLIQQDLADKANELKDMQEAKKRLLAETSGEERAYQQLVDQSRRQQAEALLEINDLQSQLGVVDNKLNSLKGDLGEAAFEQLLKNQSSAGLSGVTFPGRMPRLTWPASPSGGITAYFHDSAYAVTFGVAHQAIDFRLRQSTPVGAAAPGIVYKAKDNGYGYNYIMLAHPGGLATVYGHISKIMVKEGQTVRAGDIIGLSGGTPSTLGAGYMTTGAHLHFEVLDGGQHSNPLDYLPLEQLPLGDIPQRYLKFAKGLR
ncbi:MAG: peptidoglycan DD-metalloendopeptidase family protein [Candidatus Gracilibacteria bacterium]